MKHKVYYDEKTNCEYYLILNEEGEIIGGSYRVCETWMNYTKPIKLIKKNLNELFMKKEELKELNSVIQICDCGKVDAYKGDGHDCATYLARLQDPRE